MKTMSVTNSIKQLVHTSKLIEELEEKLDSDNRVTAGSKDSIVRQIEELRRKLRRNADELEYDNIQNLAAKLHEVIHVLSDLISARAVKGADTKLFQKLASKIIDVTRALNLGGDEELDKDGDGFLDDADISFLNDTEEDDSSEHFKNVVKKALNPEDNKKEPNKSEDTKPNPFKKDESKKSDDKTSKEEKEDKKEKPKKEILDEDSEDDTSDDGDNEEEPENKKSEKKLKKKSKGEPKEKKGKSGGFMDSLDEEATSSFEANAGFRFNYVGIKKIKRKGEEIRVLKAMYGSNSDGKQDAVVYYYTPTEKLFSGSVDRTHAAFLKVLAEKNGYHALAIFIPKLIKSGKLIQIKKKNVDVTSELHKDGSGEPTGYWSYIGLDQHPTKPKLKAIWFEVGDDKFAAMPSKRFEGGDVYEADSWIKLNILGNKDSSGKSYRSGLKILNKLVNTGKLKVIFHSAV